MYWMYGIGYIFLGAIGSPLPFREGQGVGL